MRFITKKIQSYLDYPVAFALIGLPFILELGETNYLAFYLSLFTGIAALMLTLLTNHQTGIIKLISYKSHLIVDFIVGVTFVLAPFILGFEGIDFIYYIVNGLAVLVVVSLQKGEVRNATLQVG